MVQNKVKHKLKLPEGVKKNSGRVQKKSKQQQQGSSSKQQPKKGQGLKIAPKNSRHAHSLNVEKQVTKIINADNENLLKQTSTSSIVAGPSSSNRK